MDFRLSEGVFGDFLVNFGRFEILENDDFLMLKIHFGLTWNLSVLIWDRPDSCFHVLVPAGAKMGPKIGLSTTDPVVLRENNDYRWISHGLKPVVQ